MNLEQSVIFLALAVFAGIGIYHFRDWIKKQHVPTLKSSIITRLIIKITTIIDCSCVMIMGMLSLGLLIIIVATIRTNTQVETAFFATVIAMMYVATDIALFNDVISGMFAKSLQPNS